MGLRKMKEAPTEPLTEEDVSIFLHLLFVHLRDNWEFYKDHLPHLRKTMVFYELFRCVVSGLPENKDIRNKIVPTNQIITKASTLRPMP